MKTTGNTVHARWQYSSMGKCILPTKFLIKVNLLAPIPPPFLSATVPPNLAVFPALFCYCI